MHPSFRRLDHRERPPPERPWSSRQTWLDLLLAHWPVSREVLRPLVPPELEVQEREGSAWIGVVPFRMEDVAPRGVPALPWLSAFAEINVRTYVAHRGVPGLWFLSLDAARWLAVWAARRFFHLPYHHARMEVEERGATIVYRSERLGEPRGLLFEAAYEPVSEPYEAEAGSLERWLTERYRLFARARDGALHRVEVHHAPWPLQRARARIAANELLAPHGIALPGRPELLHFARRLDVAVWGPERVEGKTPGRG